MRTWRTRSRLGSAHTRPCRRRRATIRLTVIPQVGGRRWCAFIYHCFAHRCSRPRKILENTRVPGGVSGQSASRLSRPSKSLVGAGREANLTRWTLPPGREASWAGTVPSAQGTRWAGRTLRSAQGASLTGQALPSAEGASWAGRTWRSTKGAPRVGHALPSAQGAFPAGRTLPSAQGTSWAGRTLRSAHGAYRDGHTLRSAQGAFSTGHTLPSAGHTLPSAQGAFRTGHALPSAQVVFLAGRTLPSAQGASWAGRTLRSVHRTSWVGPAEPSIQVTSTFWCKQRLLTMSAGRGSFVA